jgi:hypothetical protein
VGLIGAGILVRLFISGASLNPKVLESPGILLAGWGGILLARYVLAGATPQAAQRLAAEESDERSQALRNRAGSAAFTFWMIFASLVLVGYSILTMSQVGFDPLWFYMAIAVIAPGLIYVISLIWLHKRY